MPHWFTIWDYLFVIGIGLTPLYGVGLGWLVCKLYVDR